MPEESGQRVPGKEEGDWKQHNVGYLLVGHGKDTASSPLPPSPPPPPRPRTQITLSKRTRIWEQHVGSAWNNCTRRLVLKKKKYFDCWPQGRVRGTKGPFSSVGNLCIFPVCVHLFPSKLYRNKLKREQKARPLLFGFLAIFRLLPSLLQFAAWLRPTIGSCYHAGTGI